MNISKKPTTWFLIDASEITLGRLATNVSILLRGKNSRYFIPGVNMGNNVIIINAEKITITGKKETKKLYYRHSGRPGGLKIETYAILQKRFPERIIEKAIKGMLPKNSLGREYFRNLKVFKGSMHPFSNNDNLQIIKL